MPDNVEELPEADQPVWTMPKPSENTFVSFYKHGEPILNGRSEIGMIRRVNQSSVDIILLNGSGARNGVYHVDDPRLKKHPNLKVNGAWKVSSSHGGPTQEDHDGLLAKIEALAARVEAGESVAKRHNRDILDIKSSAVKLTKSVDEIKVVTGK